MRYMLIGTRLFFGLLTLVALITAFIDFTGGPGHNPVNFFSFFTITTNLFVAVVLIVGAVYLIRRREPKEGDDIIRGSAVVAIAVVGLVFGLLLSHLETGLIPWVNFVTHYLMPVVTVLDWLLQPPKTKLAPRHIWFWVIYPIAYLAYSLLRGAVVDWYPYWFINPHEAPGGWSGVILYSGAITIGFLLVSFALLWLGNKLKRNVILTSRV
jgi:hypothetical protein